MNRVAIFGPVTDAYGGSGVGGLATHGTEVAEKLPAHGVAVTYLADNLAGDPTRPVAAPWGTLRGISGAPGRASAVRLAAGSPLHAAGPLARAASDPSRRHHDIPLARAWSRAHLIAEGCRTDGARVLHIQQPDYRPLFARWAGTGLPTLLAVHGLGVADADPGGPVEALVRRNLTAAEMTTAPSRFLADAAAALGADPQRMHVVPNAVDHDLFHPRDRAECRETLGLHPARPLVVFLGRAIEMKGAHDLVEASRIMRADAPEVQTAFVGTWSLPVPAESMPHAEDPGAPILLREGAPRAELPLWLCAADVVAVPSHYEGFGLVALEALACARPLVVTRVGGLTEVVPAEAGEFVDRGDPAGLAAACSRLLADPEAAARMAQHGPVAAKRYSWSGTAARYTELYEELAARRSSSA